MKPTYIILLITGIAANSLLAQNNLSRINYKAYLTTSISLWEKSIIQQKEEIKEKQIDYYTYLTLGETYYGLLISCLASNDENNFKKYNKEVENIINHLMKTANDSSRVYALQSGIYSITMGFYPKKGMFLGPKNQKCIETALEKNSNEPRALAQKGGSKFHTPETYGGNVQEAIACYEKSIELFEQQNDTSYNWYYLNTLAWLGQSYARSGQLVKAKEIYVKALKSEPEFYWIKYILLPELNKQEPEK